MTRIETADHDPRGDISTPVSILGHQLNVRWLINVYMVALSTATPVASSADDRPSGDIS